MSNKRQQEEDGNKSFCSGDGGGNSGSSEDKRRRTFKSVVQDVMILCRLQTFMEPLVRRVVKEEVDLALRKYVLSMKWNHDKDIRTSSPRSVKLQFSSTISVPVFTGARIEAEGGSNLKVLLVDSLSGEVVSEGPGSSSKVEIVVLEGDFDGDARDNWTIEEYKNNIVKEREGKKTLLNGDVFVTLEEGIGVVGDVSFTDNSSWTRSRKFRLGARFVDNFDGIRIRAAKTESFIVRDHRGELYKKHYPPSLSDEVWRLEKIGKEGAFHKRLNRAGVCNVKDFLFLYSLDPARLRNVLGSGMSAKMWEVTVEHARTCVLDHKTYFYSPSGLQHITGVVFNIVGQVMGVLCEGQYRASEKLSEIEKDEANKLIVLASRNPKEVLLFDNEASCLDSISQLTTAPCSNLPFGDSHAEKGSFSQNVGEGGNVHLVSFSPDMTSAIYSGPCLDDFGLLDSMDGRFVQSLNFPSQDSSSFTCDADSIAQGLFEDEHLDYFNPPSSLPDSCMELSTELWNGGSNPVRNKGSPHAKSQRRRWTMLFSVLKMVFTRKTRREENPRL